MDKNELSGIIVPVITPVDNDDCVDGAAFRKVIRYLIDAGVNGIFVGGSSGEGPLLIEKEWLRMVEIAFDENNGRVNLLGGVMDTSTKKVINKIKLLEKIGYKYFVVTPTFYIKLTTPDEHLRLFSECREISDRIEMVAYNIPDCTGSEIPVEVLCECARRGWIRYCKSTYENMDYFKRLISEGKNAGLKVLCGTEVDMAEKLLAGACGLVNVCANYEPETYIRACQAAAKKDVNELMKIQERIRFLREKLLLTGDCWLAGIKYAMFSIGMGSGKPVSPLQPANEQQKKIIDEISKKKGKR